MIDIIIPTTKDKLLKQISALQYIISQDTNEKDKEIHIQALEILKKQLNK